MILLITGLFINYFIKAAFGKMNTNVIEIDQNHIVEVAVKRRIGANEKEGQKRASPKTNSISAQKSEKKRTTTSNIPWRDTFAKQNASYLKKDQAYKRCKIKDARKQQKNCVSIIYKFTLN